MSHPAIRLERVSKRYRIGAAGPSYRTLRETIMEGVSTPLRLLRGRHGVDAPSVLALQDVTFDVKPGEVLGLVGRNGAGKSTLLRVLARITRPTSGRAELRGRVGSLLDVGTGFHPELTGSENAFLNGAILGMTRRDVRQKLDQIVEFAGVEEFIDTPVKHYSSGMRVRLAFSVAAQLDTEILLADEVLAVGDVAFQKKCLDQIGVMSRSGRTVVFVSHNMGAVGELCSSAVLLDKGRVMQVGRTQEIIRRYLADYSTVAPTVDVEPPPVPKGMAMTTIAITDSDARAASEIGWNDTFNVAVGFTVTEKLRALSIGITVVNQLGVRTLFSWLVFQEPFEPGAYLAEGPFVGTALSPGRYYIDINAGGGGECFHLAQQTAVFDVVQTSGEFGYELDENALMYARVPWRVRAVGEPSPECGPAPVLAGRDAK